MAFDVSDEDIVDGPILRTLVWLAVPLVAQNFALIAHSVVDIFWVGRLGTNAVAAVGLVIPVTALLTFPTILAYAGTQILTAQRVGDGDFDTARVLPFHGLLVVTVLALLVVAFVAVAAEDIVALLDPSRAIASMSVAYLVGWVIGLVPAGLSDTFESGFVGFGNTRTAFVVNVTAIGGNVVFDPLLILGWGPFPEWGVFGAGIATAIGYTFGALLAAALVVRGNGRFAFPDTLTFDPSLVREIVTVGAPEAIKESGRQVARLVMIAIVSFVSGPAGLAAYAFGARIATVAFVPAIGLGQAARTFVGQNVGANHTSRARRVVWLGVLVGGVGLTGIAVLQWLFPVAIARVFIPDVSGLALEYTVSYLRILTFGYWSFAVIYVVQAGFSGASRTDLSMYATLLQYWFVRVPIAAVLAYALGWGVIGVFWAVTVSNVVAAVGLAAYYHRSTSSGLLERAAEAASSG